MGGCDIGQQPPIAILPKDLVEREKGENDPALRGRIGSGSSSRGGEEGGGDGAAAASVGSQKLNRVGQ